MDLRSPERAVWGATPCYATLIAEAAVVGDCDRGRPEEHGGHHHRRQGRRQECGCATRDGGSGSRPHVSLCCREVVRGEADTALLLTPPDAGSERACAVLHTTACSCLVRSRIAGHDLENFTEQRRPDL